MPTASKVLGAIHDPDEVPQTAPQISHADRNTAIADIAITPMDAWRNDLGSVVMGKTTTRYGRHSSRGSWALYSASDGTKGAPKPGVIEDALATPRKTVRALTANRRVVVTTDRTILKPRDFVKRLRALRREFIMDPHDATLGMTWQRFVRRRSD